MSHSLSNWLNHIKADDIDGGLAADFDGSFSGLGSEPELGSNPYNMRYLLDSISIFSMLNIHLVMSCWSCLNFAVGHACIVLGIRRLICLQHMVLYKCVLID